MIAIYLALASLPPAINFQDSFGPECAPSYAGIFERDPTKKMLPHATPRFYSRLDRPNDLPVASLMDDLRGFIRDRFERFHYAGDQVKPANRICVGVYDDRAAPNAFAMGREHMVIGLAMFSDLAQGERLKKKMHEMFVEKQLDTNILFGAQLDPMTAVMGLLNHELGHMLQNLHGLMFPGDTARMRELHADCAAGVMMTFYGETTHLASDRASLTPLAVALALGDFHQTTVDHHGMPVERYEAIAYGIGEGARLRAYGYSEYELTSGDIMNFCAQKYPTLAIGTKYSKDQPWLLRQANRKVTVQKPNVEMDDFRKWMLDGKWKK